MFYVVGSDVCCTAVQRTHCCASMATLSVFITFLTDVREQFKGNAILRFHGKSGYVNAPLCYLRQIAYPVLPHSVQANAGKVYCDCFLPDLVLHHIILLVETVSLNRLII